MSRENQEVVELHVSGKVSELDPHSKVRFSLARTIFVCVFATISLAAVLLVFGPESRKQEAAIVFEFAKTFGPPLLTLVIGFYFRSESN